MCVLECPVQHIFLYHGYTMNSIAHKASEKDASAHEDKKLSEIDGTSSPSNEYTWLCNTTVKVSSAML